MPVLRFPPVLPIDQRERPSSSVSPTGRDRQRGALLGDPDAREREVDELGAASARSTRFEARRACWCGRRSGAADLFCGSTPPSRSLPAGAARANPTATDATADVPRARGGRRSRFVTGSERVDQHWPRPPRLDDVVDVAAPAATYGPAKAPVVLDQLCALSGGPPPARGRRKTMFTAPPAHRDYGRPREVEPRGCARAHDVAGVCAYAA